MVGESGGWPRPGRSRTRMKEHDGPIATCACHSDSPRVNERRWMDGCMDESHHQAPITNPSWSLARTSSSGPERRVDEASMSSAMECTQRQHQRQRAVGLPSLPLLLALILAIAVSAILPASTHAHTSRQHVFVPVVESHSYPGQGLIPFQTPPQSQSQSTLSTDAWHPKPFQSESEAPATLNMQNEVESEAEPEDPQQFLQLESDKPDMDADAAPARAPSDKLYDLDAFLEESQLQLMDDGNNEFDDNHEMVAESSSASDRHRGRVSSVRDTGIDHDMSLSSNNEEDAIVNAALDAALIELAMGQEADEVAENESNANVYGMEESTGSTYLGGDESALMELDAAADASSHSRSRSRALHWSWSSAGGRLSHRHRGKWFGSRIIRRARSFVRRAASRVRSAVRRTYTRARTYVRRTYRRARSYVRRTVTRVRRAYRSVKRRVVRRVRRVVRRVRRTYRRVKRRVVRRVRRVVRRVRSGVRRVVRRVRRTYHRVASRVRRTVRRVATRVRRTYNNVKRRVVSRVRRVARRVRAGVRRVASRVRRAASRIKRRVTTAASRVKRGVRRVASRIRSGVRRVASRVKSAASRIKHSVRRVASRVRSGVRRVTGRIKSRVRSVVRRVKTGVRRVANKVRTVSRRIGNKVRRVATRVKTGVRRLANRVRTGVQRVSNRVGRGVRSVTRRVSSTARRVRTAARRVARSAREHAADQAKQIVSWVRHTPAKIRGLAKTWSHRAIEAAKRASRGVKNVAHTIGDAAKEEVEGITDATWDLTGAHFKPKMTKFDGKKFSKSRKRQWGKEKSSSKEEATSDKTKTSSPSSIRDRARQRVRNAVNSLNGGKGPEFLLYKKAFGTEASLAKKEWGVSEEGKAIGAGVYAGHVYAGGVGKVTAERDGITAMGNLNAGADLLRARAYASVEGRLGKAEARGSAYVGANAGVTGALSVGKEGVKLSGKADAFAGAKAGGQITLSSPGDFASIKARGYVSAGAGAEAGFDVGYNKGKITLSGNLGATLGLGAGGDVKVEINAAAIAKAAKDKAESLARAGVHKAKEVKDAVVNKGKAIKNAVWDAFGWGFMEMNAEMLHFTSHHSMLMAAINAIEDDAATELSALMDATVHNMSDLRAFLRQLYNYTPTDIKETEMMLMEVKAGLEQEYETYERRRVEAAMRARNMAEEAIQEVMRKHEMESSQQEQDAANEQLFPMPREIDFHMDSAMGA